MILRTLGLFLFAASLPFAATCLILWRAGVFEKFWFWTFTYAREYASVLALSPGMEILWQVLPRVVGPNWGIWILAVTGLALLWWEKPNRASVVFVSAFLIFSFLAVCPGFYFRPHYFVFVLPAVALVAGASVAFARKVLGNALPFWLFAGLLLLSVVPQREFLFRMSDRQVSRALYGTNPFPEAVTVAAYISQHSTKDSRIAVLGSEPEIYFYARRRSATSYIYTYALMEPQPFALEMQNELIRDIETVGPEYVVVISVPTSWLRGPSSPTRLFDWWREYRPRHYELVGVADIISNDETVYQWDAAAVAYQPRSSSFVAVYRRKTGA